MKTKIQITVTVEQEGQAPRTFSTSTPPCFNLKSEDPALIFHATVKCAETVLGSVHSHYIPNPTPDTPGHEVQHEDRKAPDDDGTR